MTVQEQAGTELGTHQVELTEAAVRKVREFLAQEDEADLRLRVKVEPRGCAGLSYDLSFDNESWDGDLIRDFDGVEVVVDQESAPLVAGATIDYADSIQKQGFTIENPNATGGCACGNSFC